MPKANNKEVAEATELSKKDQLILEMQKEEQANLEACSNEIAASLKKYGYELFIEQSIKVRKSQ